MTDSFEFYQHYMSQQARIEAEKLREKENVRNQKRDFTNESQFRY